jgi:hypothetical protein
MENVTFIKITGQDGIELEHAIIDRGNGEFTSMLKSTYDEIIASHQTAINTKKQPDPIEEIPAE